MVSVKVLGDKELSQQLGILRGRIGSLKPALEDVGKQIFEDEKKIFNAEGAAFGHTKWDALSDRYLKRKKGPKILQESGELFRQATSKAGGFKISNTKLEHSVDLPYAAVHQFGYSKKNIPKREYLFSTKEQEKTYSGIVDIFVLKQAKAAGLSVIRISA